MKYHVTFDHIMGSSLIDLAERAQAIIELKLNKGYDFMSIVAHGSSWFIYFVVRERL